MESFLIDDVIIRIVEACENHCEMISILSVNKAFHNQKQNFSYDRTPVLYHPSLDTLFYASKIKEIHWDLLGNIGRNGSVTIPPVVNTLSVLSNDLHFYNIPPTIHTLCVFLHGCLPSLPKTITRLEILGTGFFSLNPGSIPEWITYLKLPRFTYGIGLKGLIPNSVKTLDIGENHNFVISPDLIPNSVSHLIFSKKYKLSIQKECYPESLSELTVGRNFKDLNPDGTFLYNPNVKINFI